MKRVRDLVRREIGANRRNDPVARGERVIQYFLDIVDEWFFPYHEWPEWVREQIILEHKNNDQRYQLFVFFVANGLSPTKAAQWIRVADAIRPHIVNGRILRKGRLIFGDYDKAAMRQLEVQMPRQYREGTLIKQGKRIFDMILRRPTAWDEQAAGPGQPTFFDYEGGPE